ncbi:MAG: isopentenyl phosphate kinase [Chloroflexi bacterium]|nr:isopentenyl phosphate kinase [Chloroflexota bacterium]
MIFLKLGGSLITDKTRDNTARLDVIARLAAEIAAYKSTHEETLLIGHGSGSFGHAAARRYGTRDGVHSAEGWRGFAEVSVVAARLNRLVADALNDAGVPVVSIAPSASAQCVDGRLVSLDTRLIDAALGRRLAPLVMGDVALDSVRGGTIVSTEEVFAYLAGIYPVSRILLAGETAGVYRSLAQPDVVERITPQSWAIVRGGIGGSHGADVTGGMASKVRDMLDLVAAHPRLTVRIFSGAVAGNVTRALDGESIGTLISAEVA